MLELLARGVAVGAFVGLALVMARGLTRARLTGALFCLAAAAHTLTQLPQSATTLGWAWPPIWALSVMGAGLFWAFVLELFEDRPDADARPVCSGAAAVAARPCRRPGAAVHCPHLLAFAQCCERRAYRPRPVRRLERMAGRSRRAAPTIARADPGHIRSVCVCRHRRANLGNLLRVRALPVAYSGTLSRRRISEISAPGFEFG